MSYRISYEKNMVKKDLLSDQSATRLNRWIISAVICILLVCALSSSTVRSYLLPGDPQITEAALNELADDLREGESVADAVTAFCREILNNA